MFGGPQAGLAAGPPEASCRELFHPAKPEHDIIELGGAENNARGVKVFWLASYIAPSHKPAV